MDPVDPIRVGAPRGRCATPDRSIGGVFVAAALSGARGSDGDGGAKSLNSRQLEHRRVGKASWIMLKRVPTADCTAADASRCVR